MSLAAATQAKEEGSDLFRDGKFAEALLAYSRGIQLLFGSGSVPIVDFGLGERSSPLPVHSSIPEAAREPAAQLGATLLSNRAAAALKLGRNWRALTDATHAVALQPLTPKLAFRRAQALLAVGACQRAVEVLAPSAATEAQNATLMQTAQSRATITDRAARALAIEPAHQRRSDENTQPLDAFVGPLAVRAFEGARTRGWVATEPVEAGALLLIEHLSLPRSLPTARALPRLAGMLPLPAGLGHAERPASESKVAAQLHGLHQSMLANCARA